MVFMSRLNTSMDITKKILLANIAMAVIIIALSIWGMGKFGDKRQDAVGAMEKAM